MITFIFCCCIFSNDYIKGRIINHLDKPIENANIQLANTDISSTSDSNGFFIVEANLEDSVLIISHVKYKTRNINVTDENNITIKLDDAVINLDQYVVTGMRTQTYIKNTPVLTHVITSDDFQKSGFGSVKEALEMSLPNVQNVMSSHAGISNEEVKIQGLDNKYLLFLVDGKRVSGEFAGNLDFKMLNLSNIDRIEVIEGGMSSLYGSSAIGGVVNIITKKNDKPYNLSYTYFQDDPLITTHSINSNINFKNYYYGLNYVQQQTEGYDLTPAAENYPYPIKTLEEYETNSIEHSIGYFNKDISIDINYKDYSNDIFLYENKLFQGNDNPEYYQIYKPWIPKFQDISYGFDLEFYSGQSRFNISYNFEEYIKSNYYFNYDEENCSLIDCTNQNNLNSKEFINASDKRKNFLMQYNKESKNNFFTLGLELNADSYSSFNIYHNEGDYQNNGLCDEIPGTWPVEYDCLVQSIFGAKDSTENFNKTALYIGNQWSLINENKIGASLRYVNSPEFNDDYVASLSYMIKKFESRDIRLNYSKGFRTPSIKELYYNWYGHSPAIIGNPDLVPTTNNYFSASVQTRNIGYDYSFELFYNDVVDMIGINYTEDENGTQVAQYNNIKNILFYGINTHYNKKFNKNEIKIVYNFTQPVSDDNEALELISKHALRLNLNSNIIDKKLSISFNTKYLSSKYIYLSSDKIELEDYFLADILLSYNLNDYLKFKIGCKNLFDYKDDRRFLDFGNDFLTSYDPGRRLFFEMKFNLLK